MSEDKATEQIVFEIWRNFQENEYQWMLDGMFVQPTKEQIKYQLIRLAKELIDSEEANYSLIEAGRLMVKQDGEHLDVYMWMGEIQDELNGNLETDTEL